MGVYADTEMAREEFVGRVGKRLNVEPHVMATGPEQIGAWASSRARRERGSNARESEGIDTFLTGEGPHHTYFDAEELGLNVLYAGHYATETVGVKALGQHLKERFGLETFFLDHPPACKALLTPQT